MAIRKKEKESLWYAIVNQKKLNAAEYKKLINRVITFVSLSFIGSFFVFLAVAWFGGLSDVINLILTSKIYIYALAFVAVFASYLISFVKWSYYLRVLKIKVSKLKSLQIYLSLYAMNLTPGNIGRVVAAYTLSKVTDIELFRIVPIVTMDIFTDSLGMALLALIAAIYFNIYVIYVIFADLLLLLPVFLLLIDSKAYKLLYNFFKRHKRLKVFSIYGDEYFAAQSKLNKKNVYIVSILTSLPAAFLTSLALLLSLSAIGINVHTAQSVFVFSISQLFGMVSTIPGNIGVTDVAILAIGHATLGLSNQILSATEIMVRLATLWFGVVLGAVFLFYTMRFWKYKPNPRVQKIKSMLKYKRA